MANRDYKFNQNPYKRMQLKYWSCYQQYVCYLQYIPQPNAHIAIVLIWNAVL